MTIDPKDSTGLSPELRAALEAERLAWNRLAGLARGTEAYSTALQSWRAAADRIAQLGVVRYRTDQSGNRM